jgi:CheY-like chemotaxis protein
MPPPVHSLLIAEDDRAVRDSLVRALELEGYTVTAVGNGAEALEVAGSVAPDVVVLDVSMPIVDGLTVCKVLRADGNRVPILMLTARTETRDRVAGLDAGPTTTCRSRSSSTSCWRGWRALLRRSQPGADPAADAVQLADLRLDRRPAGRGAAGASWSCRRRSSTSSSCSCANQGVGARPHDHLRPHLALRLRTGLQEPRRVHRLPPSQDEAEGESRLIQNVPRGRVLGARGARRSLVDGLTP